MNCLIRGLSRMTVNESKLAEIRNDLYLIYHGVRDCCIHSVYSEQLEDEEFMEKIEKDVKFYKLKYLSNAYGDELYKELFFYKYDHQRVMYMISDAVRGQSDVGVYVSKYITGKLLGYSNQDMEEFLERVHHTSDIMKKVEEEIGKWKEKSTNA